MAQENPAQPNFVAIADAYASLAQELPLFANLPVANVQQQLDQVIAGIAAMNQRLAQILQEQQEHGQRLTQIVQNLGDVNNSLAGIDGRLQAVQQRMDSVPIN